MLKTPHFVSFIFALTLIGSMTGCHESQEQTKQSAQSEKVFGSNSVEEDQVFGIIEVEEDLFETRVLKSESLVLLDFWAEWCLPCLELNPLMPELSDRFRDQLLIAKVNIEDHPNLVAEYVPDTIYPCLILMRNGEVLDRRYGTDPEMDPKAFLFQWVQSYLDDIKQPGNFNEE